MRVVFSPEARLEFEEAERYYNEQLQGLGSRFRAEIRTAMPRIQKWPLSAPVERGAIRRLTLTRFPYKLLYSVEGDHIYVLAVAISTESRTTGQIGSILHEHVGCLIGSWQGSGQKRSLEAFVRLA